MSEQQSRESKSGHNPLLRGFSFLDKGLGALENFIIGGSVLVMAAVMTAQVAGRFFFGIGVPGAAELTEILIIVMTFVGVSFAVRCARHISMSAVYDQLTGRARKTFLVVITLGTGALMFYLAWESLGYVEQIFERGRRTSALQIHLWMVYSVLPIGFTLAGIQYWLTALRNVTTEGMWRSFSEYEEYSDVPDGNGNGSEAVEEDAGETRGHL